jgi:type II secretion system protein G
MMKNTLLFLSLVFFGASTDAQAQSEAATAAKSARPKTGPERGTFLFIRTKPDGAKVLVDGKQVGISDDLFAVDPGVRRIIVELEGHDPNGRDVTVRAGRIERVNLKLIRRSASLPQASAGPAPAEEAVGASQARPGTSTKVFLPNGDDPQGPAILDLASGDILTGKSEAEVEQLFRQGKGDVFVYRGHFGCLRGARPRWSSGLQYVELPVSRQDEHAVWHKLLAVPCRLQITTGEGKLFDLTISSATEKGTEVEYRWTGKTAPPEIRPQQPARKPGPGEYGLAANKMLDLAGDRWAVYKKPIDKGMAEGTRQSGIGDLYFAEGLLGCVRGCTAKVWDGNEFKATPPQEGSDPKLGLSLYKLRTVPCRLLITTPEKKHFEVDVLEEVQDKLIIKFRSIDPSPGPETALIDSLKFGPTREHLLFDLEGESRDTFIDLDTNTLTTGLPDADDDAREAYIKRAGIDAGAYVQDGQANLGGYRMVTDSAGKPFDQVTPRDVFDAVVRGDPSASHTALVYADSAFQTYFFGTREGTIGILEMLEPLTEGPNRGMRMRYKTVCRVVSKPGGNEPRVVPWKLTFEMMKVAIAVRKKEFLPNVEPMGEEPDSEMKAFLDLASGEMLAWKPEMTGETNADATGHEKGGPYFSASAGDLCFSGRAMDNAPNGAIICLRGARAMLWSAGEYRRAQPKIIRLPRKGTWWFGGVTDPPQDGNWEPCAYAIPNVPCSFRICTAEKKYFDVGVAEVKKGDSEISGVEVWFRPSHPLTVPNTNSVGRGTMGRRDALTPRPEPTPQADLHLRLLAYDQQRRAMLVKRPVPPSGAVRVMVGRPTPDLSDTTFTDEKLAHLKMVKNLIYADLSGAQVTDAGIQELKEHKQLMTLDLRDTAVTAEGISALQSELPHLRTVIHHSFSQPMVTSFGPAVERSIRDDGVGKSNLLDLDTGEFLLRPSRDDMQRGESHRSGADLGATTHPEVPGLWGIDLSLVPADNEQWDSDPAEIWEMMRAKKADLASEMPCKLPLPRTFFFKTAEGGVGILQIVELTGDETKAVTMRYKLVQYGMPSSKTWTCAMHPMITVLLPGKCPVCERQLSPTRLLPLGRGRSAALSKRTEDVISARGPKPEAEKDLQRGLGARQTARSSEKRLSFGPVVEKVLLDNRSGKDCYIDFDTGRLFGKSRPEDKDVNRIDAGASLEADRSALLSLGMLVFPVDDKLWDDGSPLGILEKTVSDNPGKPIMEARDTSTQTYVFKTPEGAVGILQVLGSTDDEPQGIRIRYKLVVETQADANVRTAQAQIKSLRIALARYRVDVGKFPDSEAGLTSLVSTQEDVPPGRRWTGPYVKPPVPTDPWGNPYQYRFPGKGNPASFDLWSAGSDGKSGTDDDIGVSDDK